MHKVAAILFIIIVLILTDLVSYSRNIPSLDWVSGKTLLANYPMGSRETMTSRNITHRSRLNLKAWHGCQELLLNRSFKLSSLKCEFSLRAKGSYFCIIFNKRKESYSGFRISRSPEWHSLFFRAKEDGQFTHHEKIPNVINDNRWNTLEIASKSGSVILKLNGVIVAAIPERIALEQTIGIRGGRHECWVDNLVVHDFEGNVVLSEDFHDNQDFFFLLFYNLVFVSLFFGSIYLCLRTKKTKEKLFLIIIFQVCLIVLLIGYYAVDFFDWSGKYYRPFFTHKETFLEKCEEKRLFLFHKFPFYDFRFKERRERKKVKLVKHITNNQKVYTTDLVVVRKSPSGFQMTQIKSKKEKVIEHLKKTRGLKSARRILLIGTSQTWGSGAHIYGKRIEVEICRNLYQRYPQEKFAIINGSKRGSRSHKLHERYDDHIFLFQPHLVIVNLSCNDSQENLPEGLERIVATAKKHGHQLVFVQEAFNFESNRKNLRKKHAIMKSIGDKYGIPVFNLDEFLADKHSKGFLWWDGVHMSSFAQRISVEFLLDSILEKLPLNQWQINKTSLGVPADKKN